MLKYITKKIILKYLIAFAILGMVFFVKDTALPEFISFSFPTLRFLATTYIFLQTIALMYRVKNKIDQSQTDNIVAGLTNGFTIIFYASLFFLVLLYNGISVIQFFTSISIVAAAIAIISKDYITSLISGFIISFTKVINIGDYVTIGEFKGEVKEIKLVKFYLEDNTGQLIILNNDKVFSSDIINHSRSDKRRVNLKFEISTQHLIDTEVLEEGLKNILKEFNDSIVQDSLVLRVEDVLVDKIVFSTYYTLQNLKPEVEKAIRKKSLRMIIKLIQSDTALVKQSNPSKNIE